MNSNMNCSICGQSLDRSGVSTETQWVLAPETQRAADDVNGDLCAECGDQIERRCQSGTAVDYHLTKRPRDIEHSETIYPVRMEVVEGCRPER